MIKTAMTERSCSAIALQSTPSIGSCCALSPNAPGTRRRSGRSRTVENSTEGAVGRTLDLMCQTPLTIVGEIKLRIVQNLLARDVALDTVTRVYSHAQSLAQCVQWLARHLPSAARVAVASNAEAARL